MSRSDMSAPVEGRNGSVFRKVFDSLFQPSILADYHTSLEATDRMSLTDPDPPVSRSKPHLARPGPGLVPQWVRDLPIISPHGHCDRAGFGGKIAPFPQPRPSLFVCPRSLFVPGLASQGVHLIDLGVPRSDGARPRPDPRAIWRRFAENFPLFRATPFPRMWLKPFLRACVRPDHALVRRTTADACYDHIEPGWPMTPFAHARPLSASTSRRWPPPKARWTI